MLLDKIPFKMAFDVFPGESPGFIYLMGCTI